MLVFLCVFSINKVLSLKTSFSSKKNMVHKSDIFNSRLAYECMACELF